MSETIEELKAALASEKSARLKAEADLKDANESLEMELKENLQLFDLLGLRTKEDFGNDNSTAALARKIHELITAKEKAEAECAEMRRVLERCVERLDNLHHSQTLKLIRDALSTSCGTGWLSSETIKEFIDSEVTDDEGAIVNARDHGEWDRLKYLEGHKAGLLWVKHHVQALAALKVQP